MRGFLVEDTGSRCRRFKEVARIVQQRGKKWVLREVSSKVFCSVLRHCHYSVEIDGIFPLALQQPGSHFWCLSLMLDLAGREVIAISSASKQNLCHMTVELSMKPVFMCQKGRDTLNASEVLQSQISLSDPCVYRAGGKLGMSGFIPHVDSQLSYSEPKPLLVTLPATNSNCQPAKADNSRGKLPVCFSPKTWILVEKGF